MVKTLFRGLSIMCCAAALCGATVRVAYATCAGDCNGDQTVTVPEVTVGVNIALGNAGVGSCSAMDPNGDGSVSVSELIRAVGSVLQGCPAADTCSAPLRQCTPNEVDEESCGGHPSNVKKRVCGSDCQWGGFGACGCSGVQIHSGVCNGTCESNWQHYHDNSPHSGSCGVGAGATRTCAPDCGTSFTACALSCPSGFKISGSAHYTPGCNLFLGEGIQNNTVFCVLD